MAPIINVASSANWQQVYDANFTAEPVLPRGYSPIPAFTIPVEFDSHTLVIGAAAFQVKPTWNLAFWASQRISISGVVQNAECNSRPIILGASLVTFPVLSETYFLRIRIPRWYKDMSLRVWKYTGVTHNTNDLIGDLQILTARIEAKLNEINAPHNP